MIIFSKKKKDLLDPFQYFTKYIPLSFLENIALFTNMKHVKLTGKSLGTTPREIAKFFGCSMLIAIFGLLRIRMYWNTDTRVQMVANNFGKNRYFQLRSRLKVVDYDQVSEEARAFLFCVPFASSPEQLRVSSSKSFKPLKGKQ
jgi:hypothetical protein